MEKNKESICLDCFWNENDGCCKEEHGEASECEEYYEFEQALYDIQLSEGDY